MAVFSCRLFCFCVRLIKVFCLFSRGSIFLKIILLYVLYPVALLVENGEDIDRLWLEKKVPRAALYHGLTRRKGRIVLSFTISGRVKCGAGGCR